MFTVTLPNGKQYTYRDRSRAFALARKTGGLVHEPRQAYARKRMCPHGSTYGFCDRGACDEGEW